ncbi:sigma-54-dependent transcriptional regulator [Synoicihabitans lomoniglobus]|uniref:Sigma-54 dependent transcriptional regulator n=1 Tax=Synoicihabitans lomoniglobus TaxID=2909285 RepID=A0AAE9ZVH1_9BACT|nr:sigma-54 dependent transcriptional regulator [Opitutaceae bacterium LMO-M01]WED63218.1 sigma-54 dependent transcriptional regulator [Opitutaceae bacterium LMO-M01]
MPLERILVVDDEPLIQRSLGQLLRRRKLHVSVAGSIQEGEAELKKEAFDLVFLDVNLPDGDGKNFLERIVDLPERPLVVMITGQGSIEHAVTCMQIGAFDYLLKPFAASHIDVVLGKTEAFRKLVRVNRYLTEREHAAGDGLIFGRSPAMNRLQQLIARVAPSDVTVFVTGENGTGKEMISRELFRQSHRRDEPYIRVNCAVLSESLIESELFGHERGAFTGATTRREGRFELAHKGTLLLDEVSEIPPSSQAKLLRVLQEREFERVGGTKTIKVDVRIIATSNRDLAESVAKGEFRSDLYYRLNVFPVHVPPLRDRPDDIEVLANEFLQRFSRRHRLALPGFTPEALRTLETYRWPGNVRELENTIERAVILGEAGRPVSAAQLNLPDLPASFRPESAPPAVAPTPPAPLPVAPIAEETLPPPVDPPSVPKTDAPVSLSALEQNAILEMLHANGGNRTQTAEKLQISIRTLRNKLTEYRAQGIEIPGDR